MRLKLVRNKIYFKIFREEKQAKEKIQVAVQDPDLDLNLKINTKHLKTIRKKDRI